MFSSRFLTPRRSRYASPNGAAAHNFLAANRAARIRGERHARPAPTLQEQQAAREARAAARDEQRQLELGDYLSVASLATADPLGVRHF